MLDRDGAEAAARRETHAKNMGLVTQVASWVEAAPPLIEWGWSEHVSSSWMPPTEEERPDRERGRGSLPWAQLTARLRRVITTRMDLSQLQVCEAKNTADLHAHLSLFFSYLVPCLAVGVRARVL
jgi:hypothetical protein